MKCSLYKKSSASLLGKMSLMVIALFFAGMANAANWFWIGGNGTAGSPGSFTNNANWATTYGGSTTGTPNYTSATDNFVFDGGNIGSGTTNNSGSSGTPLYVNFPQNVSVGKIYFTGNVYVYFATNGISGAAGGSITCSSLDLGTSNGIGSGSNVAGCYFNDGGNTILVTGLNAGANAITGSTSGIHTSPSAVSTTATAAAVQYAAIDNSAQLTVGTSLTLQASLTFPSGTFLLTGTYVPAGATFTGGYTGSTITMSAASTSIVAANAASAWYVYTTASALSGATTLTVQSGLTIPIGTQIYPGTGIAAGTTVIGYSGTTLTLSKAITTGISANQGLVPLALTGTFTIGTGLSIAVGDLVTGGVPGTTNVSSNVYVQSYNSSTGALVVASTNGTYNATLNSVALSSAAINISGEIKLAAAANQTIPTGLTFGNLDLSASAAYTYTIAGSSGMNVGNLYYTKNATTSNTNITLADGGNTINVSGGIFYGIGAGTASSGTGQFNITGSSPYLGNGAYNGTIIVNSMNLKTGNTITSFYCDVTVTSKFSFDASNATGTLELFNNPGLTIGSGGAATYVAALGNTIRNGSASNSGAITINSSNNTSGSPVGTFYFDATNYKFAALILTNGYATFATTSTWNSSSTLTSGTLVTATGANISFLNNTFSLNGGTLNLGTNSTVLIAAAIAGTGGSGTGINASAAGAGVTFYGPGTANAALALPQYFFANTNVTNLTDSVTVSTGSSIAFNSAAAALTVTNLKLANTSTGILSFNVFNPVSITIPTTGSFTLLKSNASAAFNYTAPTYTSGTVSIGYAGTIAMTTGSELTNATSLQNLTINNSAGVTIANGSVVSSISLTAGGSYTTNPTVSFSGGSPTTAATATAYLNLGAATYGTVTGGSGYTNGTAVTFSGGGGNGLTATINVTSGAITGITITNPGVGYTSLPTMTFTGGSGGALTFASAPLLVYLTGSGAGYTSTPTISFSSGSATATATRLTTSVTVNNTLTLTAGALTNTTSNLTMANGSTISRSAGTLAATPVYGTSGSSRVNVTITATCTAANELLGTTGLIGTLTVNGVNSAGVITPATYSLAAPVAIDALNVTNSGDIFNAVTYKLSGNTSNTITSSGLGTVQTQCVTGTSSTPLPATSGGWAGTVSYNNNTTSAVQTVVGGTYTNLNFGGAGATTTLTASGNITVNGALTSTYSGNTLDMTSAYILSGSLTSVSIVGTIKTEVLTSTSATPIPSGKNWGTTGTVYYGGAGAQSLPAGTFNNLSIYVAGTAVSMTGAVTVGSQLYFSTGTSTLIVGANTLTLKGSVSQSGSGGNINATNGSATVVYNGSSAQTISANTYTTSSGVNINNLTINNTSTGASAGVTLSQNIAVGGTLTLTQGRVNTLTNTLSMSSNAATITGAGIDNTTTPSYINGPFAWNFASGTNSGNYKFPVGVYSSGDYLYSFTLATPVASVANAVTVQANKSNAGGSAGSGLSSVSTNEYWSLTTSTGTVSATTVSLSSAAASGAGDNAVSVSSSLAGTYNSLGAGTIAYPLVPSSSALSAGGTYYFALGIASCSYCITGIVPTSAYSFQSSSTANGYYGQQVTITGNGLSAITSLTVNGSSSIAAASFVSQSNFQIVVAVPSDASLSGNIVATNGTTPLSSALTVNGYISNAATDWNTGSTWLGGAVPATSGAAVVVNNAITLNGTAALAPSGLTITSGNKITFGASGTLTVNTSLTNSGTIDQTSGGTLTLASGIASFTFGTFNNNSGANGTVVFAGTATVTGTLPAFNNLTVGGSVTLPSTPTVNGTLTFSSTSSSLSQVPTYGTSSTLSYTAAPYTIGTEWGGGNTVGGVLITGTSTGTFTNSSTITTAGTTGYGFTGSGYSPTVSFGLSFTNSNAYTANQQVSAGGYLYTVTTAGTSAASGIPTWPTTVGATVTSGTVTFTCAGTAATGTANVNVVGAIQLTSAGSGYTYPPTVTISGGGGSGATAEVILTAGPLTGIGLTNQGTGYTSAPTVTIGTGFSNNTIYSLGTQITASGYVYTVTTAGTSAASGTPTWPSSGTVTSGGVTFTYAGTAATATAYLGVGSITITNAGSGYISASVSIATFANNYAYSSNQQIIGSGYVFTVTTAGTSASSGTPTWPTTLGATVTSGGVTFTNAGIGVAPTGTVLGAAGYGIPENITINTTSGTVTTPSGGRAIPGTLTLTTGNLTAGASLNFLNGATLSIASSSTLTMGTYGFYALGTFTSSGAGTITTTNGGLFPRNQTWSGTVTYNLNTGSFEQVNPGTYNNLNLDGGYVQNRNMDFGSGYGDGVFTINGTLSWNGSTLPSTNRTTFNFTGAGSSQAISTGLPFYNLGFTTTGTVAPYIGSSNTGSITVANIFNPGTVTGVIGGTITYNVPTGGGNLASPQTITGANYTNLTITGTRAATSVTLDPINIIGIAGAFTNSSTNTTGAMVTTNSTVNYNGTGAQTVLAMTYNNLTIGGVRSGSPTIALGSTINVAGAFNVNYSGTASFTGNTLNITGASTSTISSPFTNSGSTTINNNGATLVLGAAFTNTGGLNFTGSGNGTLQLNAGGSVSVAPSYTSTSTLIYSGTNTVGAEWGSGTTVGTGVPQTVTINSGTVTTPSSLRTVVGNLNINGGNLSLGSGGLQLYGSWNNAGTFTPNGYNITFGGSTSSATITNTNSGTETFYGLTIGNSSGVTLGSNVTTSTLTLGTGILAPNGYTLKVSNNSASAVSGYSSSSYINGPLSWTFNTSSGTYNFPVGTSSYYYPFQLITPNTGGSTITTTVTGYSSGSSTYGSLGSLQSISNEYWKVVTSASLSSIGNVSLTSSSVTSSSVVAFSTGSTYTNENTSGAGGGGSGTVTSADALGTNTTQYYAVATVPGFSLGTIVPTSLGFAQANTTGYYGQTITINGSSFSSSTTVKIGSVDITSSITSQTSSALILSLPTTVSTGTITVADGANSGTGSFTVYGYISSAATDWATSSTWLGTSGVPTAGSTVTINSAVTVNDNTGTTTAPASINVLASTGSLTFGSSGSLTATSSFTNAGTLTMTSGGTLNIGGTISNTGTFTAGVGTINFNGATQSVPALTYNNLSISSGTSTAAGNLNVGGTLTIASSATLNLSTHTLSSVSSTSGNGILYAGATSTTPIPSGKTWSFTVNYDGTGAQTIVSGSYSTLTVSGSYGSNSVTFSGTIYVSGNYTYSATFTSGGPIVTSNTINFNGTGAQTVSAPGFVFNALTNSNTSANVTAGSNLSVTTLTLNTGSVLDMSTYGLYGSVSNSGIGTLRTANTTTTPIPASITYNCLVEFSATGGGQTIPSGSTVTTFANGLKCDNTSGVDTVIGGGLTINGQLQVPNGGTFAMGANNLGTTGTFNGTAMYGYFHTSGGGSTTYQFPINTTWGTGSTVVYLGTGNNRIVPSTYYNLNVDNGVSQTINLDNVVNSTATVTINGTLSTVSTVLTARFTTVVFNGTGQTIPAWGFYNLTLGTNSVLPYGTVTVYGTFNPGSTTSASKGIIAIAPSPGFANLTASVPAFTYNGLTLSGVVNSISNQTGYTYNGSTAISMSTAAGASIPTGAGITGTNIPASTTVASINSTAAYTPLSSPYYIAYNSVYYFAYDTLIANSIYDWGKTSDYMTVLTSGSFGGVYVKSHFGNQQANATNLYTAYTSGVNTITVTKNSSNSALNPGMLVTKNTTDASGITIPAGTYIQSIGTATSIGGGFYTFTVTLSANVTGPGSSSALVDFGAVNVLSGAISSYTSGTQYSTSTFAPGVIINTAATGTGTSTNISTYNTSFTFASGITVDSLFTDSHTGTYASTTINGPVTIANGGLVNISSTTFEGNLTIANSATVTATGAVSINKTLTIGTGAVLNMSTYVLSANTDGGSSFSSAGSGTLETQNGNSSGAIPSGQTWSGTVWYNSTSTSAQYPQAGTYNNLNLFGGNRTLPTGGTINITGNYTPTSYSNNTESSTFKFNGSGSQSINLASSVTGVSGTWTTVGSSAVVTCSTTGLGLGMIVSGTGIATNATITAITATTITVSSTTATGTSVLLNFAPATTTTFYNLTIANPLTLNCNINVGTSTLVGNTGTLTLTSGVVSTTSTYTIAIGNTATTAISGASTASYINGPVIWTLPASLASGSTYNFPVGTGSTYLPFSLVNPTTGTGTVTAEVQAVAGSTGGSIDGTLQALSGSEYWQFTKTGNFTNSGVSLAQQAAITPYNTIAGSSTLAGTYTNLAGTASTDAITGSNNIGTNTYFTFAESNPVPNAPTINSVADGDMQVTITYTAPASNGGSAVIDYTVTAIPSSGSNIVMTGVTANPYTFTGLTDGTAYTFTVAARNTAGTGTPSVASSSVTPSSTTTWTGIAWTAGAPINSDAQSVIIAGNLTSSTFTHCNNLTINSGVTFNTTSTIQVTGIAVVVNGTINGGTIVLSGTAAQTVSGTGVVGGLTVNNSNGVTVSSGSNNLGVSGVLTLQSGTLTTNGNLTMKSLSISNSGVVAPIGASGNSGTISGNVTVERFIPSKWRSLRDLCAAGVYASGNTLYNTWQESGSYSQSGHGLFITGATSTAGSSYSSNHVDNGSGGTYLDYSLNSYPSAYYWSTATQAWDTIKNTNTTSLNPYQSYRILVRGDRGFDLYTTPILHYPNGERMYDSTALRTTGSLIYGNVTYSTSGVTNGVTGSAYTSSTYGLSSAAFGYSYIANPYDCPIDFHNIYSNGRIANMIYGYWYLDPTVGETGGYVAYNAVANVTNTGYSNGNFIQAGQGFLVANYHVDGTHLPSIQITEADKSIASSSRTSVFGATAPTSKLFVGLLKGSTRVDGVAVVFGNNFSNGIGLEDSRKLSGGTDNLSIKEGSNYLSIDGRLPATSSDVLGIYMGKPSTTSYQLRVDASGYINEGYAPLLYDAYKNTTRALSGIDTVSFTVDASTAATYANRFSIIFTPSALAINSIVASATLNDKIATINWNTIGEKGESYFEVEKSTDGKNFTSIGQQAAKNTATASYSATDNSVASGNNYYRIKAVSETGAVNYSNVAKLTNNSPLTTYSLYPNPLVGKTLNVALNNVASGKYVVSIYNVLGEKVIEQTISHSGGSTTHALTINNMLARGIYSVTIREASSNQIVHQTSLSVQP